MFEGLYIIACVDGNAIYNFLPHLYTNAKQAKNALMTKLRNKTVSDDYNVFKLDERTTFMNMKKVK